MAAEPRAWCHRITFALLVLAASTGVAVWLAARDQIVFCEAGTYFFAERDICLQCAAGTYSSDNWTACEPCAAGSFCSVGATSPTENECPRGSFCPQGAAHPVPCPRGRYGAQAGLTTENCSGPCDLMPGSYCELASVGPQDWELCPVGHFCSGSNPERCPAGRYGAQTGLATSECSGECPAGAFCEAGSTNASVPCPAGFYCPLGVSAPLPCEAGCYCTQGSGTACPNKCPSGTHCPGQDVDASQPCPAGSGCPDGIALPCAPGSYCPEGAWSDEQVICPKGFHCPATSASPVPCPSGSFGNETGMANETKACRFPCPPGYYCPPGTSDESILPCPAAYWCPQSTPGEYLVEEDGSYQTKPMDDFKCPGGLRVSRTRNTMILGCFCNYTGAVDPDCACPAGYYCPPGTTPETVRACPFNHYCPEGSALPILCEEPGYYCSRYSATPRFRTVRAELSLYALTNGLAIEQNNSGLSDLAEAFASRQGISTNEAVVELRTNNLPVYSVERGIAELRLDLYSRGLSRLPNVLSTCQIDDEGNSLGRVRDVWEIPLANNSADPEVHVGEVVYPIPRDYPTGNSFAFCLTYVSGSGGLRTTLTERFSVTRSFAAHRQWQIVSGLLWPGLLGWAFIFCTQKLQAKKGFKPERRKNLEFERFRSYHTRFKPRSVDTVFAICMLALDTPLALLILSPPLDYSYSLILCVYATVGMLLTRRGDEDVILAPFFEQLLGPIMSVLLYTSTACPYTSESEFLDEIVLQGLQCWWDPRHAIVAALGLVFAIRYFEQAYAFATRKSGVERVALPVVPAFDVLMLFVRTWLAVAQALGNLANLGLVLAPLLAVLLLGLVVLPVQVKQQPYFGTPFAHRVNDVVAGNFASQIVAAIVTVIAQGWSYAHLFFVPCTWACMFAINAKRSKWSTKRLKRRLADSLTPEDEDIAFAYAHEYGLTSGFTHRILRSLGKSGQNAAALRLEKLCVQTALQQANANVNIMALKARDVVFPAASSSVFMSSAWTHVKVLNLRKLEVDDATASRLFDALSSLGNVSDLDLSENLLTLDSIVPFLRDVLPIHPGLARVNLLHNAGVLPFQISPAKVLCPLFASTRSCLLALCLHERALFNARWTVKIHRYHRDRAMCDWMYELVSGLLEQPNVDLRLVLGRGPHLQQEAMRAIMECDSAGERVANIQVDDHTIDFANDEKLVALAHVDDPTLLVTCATRMPRLVEIDISYESTQRLGGFDFVQKLAEGISKRIRLVRVRDQFVDFDTKDENLGLCGRELWDEDAPIVARLLTFCPARADLQLEGNRFGDRGIPVIVASALAGGKLRRLSLGSWKLGNRLRKAGAAALAELLFAGSSNSTLRELDLRHNQIGPIGCRELVQSRSLGQLCVLNLCGNAVSDEGAQACAEMLRTNRGLNILRLCRSRISPQGAQAIAEALCVNCTLKELYLDWNEIFDEGCLAFAQNMPSFRGLRVLAMENNMIGDQGALGLSDLGNLEELYLGYNQIGDGGVLSLRDALADASHRAPRLSVLSLTGTAVAHLGDEMLRVATTSIQVDLEYKAIKQVRNRHLGGSRRDE